MEGRYQKLCKIGAGSYGEVYRVQSQESGRHYAMKRNHLQLIARQNKLYQMVIERQVLKTLSHPGIVKLRQIFNNNYYIFYVLELCEGGELESLAEEGRAFLTSLPA